MSDIIARAFGDGFYGDCIGPEREYTTFLNMVVESFDVSTQWSNGSVLNLTLYEDLCGDFDPYINRNRPPAEFEGRHRIRRDIDTGEDIVWRPGMGINAPFERLMPDGSGRIEIMRKFPVEDMIGCPYRFAMGGFEFCGLLQNIRESIEPSGKRAWKVTLKSPEDLVDNIHLILSGYYSELEVGNIFNLGKEIESHKSYYFQEHRRIRDNLQRLYEQALSTVTACEIAEYGKAHWMRVARENIPEIHEAERELQGIQSLLDSFPPTKYGSLYYQEILWAFNKIQYATHIDPITFQDTHSAVRFNHIAHNTDESSPYFGFPHPDSLVEEHLTAWRGQYYVDLSELPGGHNSTIHSSRIPQGYRIKESSMTLGSFVKEVCGEDAFDLDYFWELRPSELRRLRNRLIKINTIIARKTFANNNNLRDPYGHISPEELLSERVNILQRQIAIRNGIFGDVTKYQIPIIKLKISPKGQNTAQSTTRMIARTVDELKRRNVSVTGHSIGLEKADDMPSMLLSGGKKEMIVTAGNNLFHYQSYITGDPLDPTKQKRIQPPRVPVNIDAPNRPQVSEYPSVWRMCFGKDRYDRAQVMFTEEDIVWVDLREENEDGDQVQAANALRPTKYLFNSVYLDSYNLKASMRFFANNINSDFEADVEEELADNNEVPISIPPSADLAVAYRVPDYIKISEGELRASLDFDLFWWSVCMHRGELFDLFVSVLHPNVVQNVLSQGGFKGVNTSDFAAITPEQQQMMRFRMWNMIQEDVFDDENLNSGGRLASPNRVIDMIVKDFKAIQEWVKKAYDQYYGKSYVTPFYFQDVTEIFSEDGQTISSYEPILDGYREYGGVGFLGLTIKDPLKDGVRGLETFTTSNGRTQSFVRFYDPLRIMWLYPPRDILGNIIPNGWGNGLNPNASVPNNAGGIMPPDETDVPMKYIINELDVDKWNPENSIRVGNFLYCKVQDVKRIRHGNLVHVTLSEQVLEYQTQGVATEQGAVTTEALTTWVTAEKERLSKLPNGNQLVANFVSQYSMVDRTLPEEGPWLTRLKAAYHQAKSNAGAGFGIASMSGKARLPIDGCYGVKCHFINYGPWILRNGRNPGKYVQEDDLTPWKFGSQLMDPEEAHRRMNTSGMLKIATSAAMHRYAHITENGVLEVAGFPSISVGAEIGSLISTNFPAPLIRHRAATFGEIYGIRRFGEFYEIYSIDERPFTGMNGPNVTRISVNVTGTGGISTKYDMTKYTPKDGFMAKHLMDKISYSSQVLKTQTEKGMEEFKRVFDLEIAALELYKQRGLADFDTGRRSNTRSPHNVVLSQNASGEYYYADKNNNNRDTSDEYCRNKTLSGVSAVDVVHMFKDYTDFFKKAYMSWDGILAPFATTDIKEGTLREIELRQRIAEQQGTVLTPAQEEDLKRHIESLGELNMPAYKKPTNVRSTISVSDGPRWTDRAALERYNRTGEKTENAMVPGHPITNVHMNPLINPASVDNNELMDIHDRKRGEPSTLGHTVSVVSRGLIPPDDVGFKSNLLKGESPYSPHYRGVGLTTPITITGWGFDTDGQPVPRDANSLDYFIKNHAAQKDKHVTGPLDVRYDTARGVWTIPTPRMYFVVMLEDMKSIDVTARNESERQEWEEGFARGEAAGRRDRNTQIAIDNGVLPPSTPLDAREADRDWLNFPQSDTTQTGYNTGYEHGLHNISKPKRVSKPNKIIYGIAKILNPKNDIEGFINVETLSGMPLKQGDRCMAWQDGAEDRYYAIPTGVTMDTGTVIRRIEPAGSLDEESGELQGGGWIMITGGDLVRAYCGMVQEETQAIPEGAIVEFLNLTGKNMIINRLC